MRDILHTNVYDYDLIYTFTFLTAFTQTGKIENYKEGYLW